MGSPSLSEDALTVGFRVKFAGNVYPAGRAGLLPAYLVEGDVVDESEEPFVIGNFACTIFGKDKCTVFRKAKCTS